MKSLGTYQIKSAKTQKNLVIVLLINIYLVLYVLDVYRISLPFHPSTGRMLIFCAIAIYTIIRIVFRPRIGKLETAAILYSVAVLFTQSVNGLFSLPKAANDLFFPVIILASVRYFYDCEEKQIRKVVYMENLFFAVFFLLFLYASFLMRLRYGMYLNSCYYCALLLPFALCVRRTWLRNVLIMACLIPTVISLKRGAYISVISGTVVYFISIRNNEDFKIYKKKYLIWGLAALVGITTVMLFMSRRLNLSMLDRLAAISDDGGAGRVQLIKGMLSLLKSNGIKGFLIGHGSFTSSQYIASSSHNDFLEMLWSYGIVGLTLYLYMIVSFIKSIKKLKTQKNEYYSPCLVAIVELFICSMVSQLVFVPTYVAFLLIILSLAYT